MIAMTSDSLCRVFAGWAYAGQVHGQVSGPQYRIVLLIFVRLCADLINQVPTALPAGEAVGIHLLGER